MLSHLQNIVYDTPVLRWPQFPASNRDAMIKSEAENLKKCLVKDPVASVTEAENLKKCLVKDPVASVTEVAIEDASEHKAEDPSEPVNATTAKHIAEVHTASVIDNATAIAALSIDAEKTLDDVEITDSKKDFADVPVEHADEAFLTLGTAIVDSIELALSRLHHYKGTWPPKMVCDVLPWTKRFNIIGQIPLNPERRTKLTEKQIELYIAHAPLPPTARERITIKASLNVLPEFDKAVTDFVKQQKGQELIQPGCDLYCRHIRSKRDQFLGPDWGPAPGTVDDGNSSLTQARGYWVSGMVFTPLFDATEYGPVMNRLDMTLVSETKTGKSVAAPLVPTGAPFINGMQSLIKLDYMPGDHPVTRNTGYQGHSVKAIKDLEPTFLGHMKMDTRHEGKYLLCRVISPPICLVDASLAVADPNGDAMRVAIHNTPIKPISFGMPTVEEYAMMFPTHTILLIKEPFLDNELETPHISVASPTDLQIMSLKDPLLANVRWKMDDSTAAAETFQMHYEPIPFEGAKLSIEKLLAMKRYFEAERMCTRLLNDQPDHPEIVTIRIIRAETLMELKRWYHAEADAEVVIDSVVNQLGKGDVGKKKKKTLSVLLRKAMLISAVACYGRRAWKPAVDAFERALQRYTDSEPLRQGLQMAKDRIKETETGIYDWPALHRAAMKGDMTSEIGDYVGPIEEKDFPGFGKGIIASRDVKAGEYLVVGRALAIIGRSSLELDQESNREMLMQVAGYHHPSIWAFMQTLVYKAYWQPEVNKQLQALYHGCENPPRPKFPFRDDADYRGTETDPINPMDMDMVAAFNTFGVGVETSPLDGESSVWKDMNGLFPSLCLFNNSCKPNCSLQRVGNVMSIRALENIPAGTELFVQYAPSRMFIHRCVKLERLMGIPCCCEHCKDNQEDGMEAHEKREKLHKALADRIAKDDFPEPSESRSKHRTYFEARQKRALEDIKEMTATYGAHRDDYRPDLTEFYHELTSMCKLMFLRSRDPAESKLYLESSFSSLRSDGIELADDPKPKGKQRIVPQLEGLPVRTLPYGPQSSGITTMIELSIHYSLVRRDQPTSLAWWKAAETVAVLIGTPSLELFKQHYEPYRMSMTMLGC